MTIIYLFEGGYLKHQFKIEIHSLTIRYDKRVSSRNKLAFRLANLLLERSLRLSIATDGNMNQVIGIYASMNGRAHLLYITTISDAD